MPFAKALTWQAPRVIDFSVGPNAGILTTPNTAIFIADGDYELVSATEIHETLATDGGGVTLDVVKCTGVQAAAAGATMLASTFNLKATINTVVRKDRGNGGLQTSRQKCQITKGDRIALNFGGVLTALTGMCVCVILQPYLRKQKW